MTYGNFYYGKDGFFYKKMTAGGVRRNFAIAAICSQPQDVNNSYVPGAGVGGTSIATRRAKLIRATKCSSGYRCGRFDTYLGIKPQQTITSLDIISEIKEVQQSTTISAEEQPQLTYSRNVAESSITVSEEDQPQLTALRSIKDQPQLTDSAEEQPQLTALRSIREQPQLKDNAEANSKIIQRQTK